MFPRSHTTAFSILALGATGAAIYTIATIPPIVRFSSLFRPLLSTVLRRALHLARLTSLCITKFFTSLVASDSTFARFRLPKPINASRERYHGGLLRAYEARACTPKVRCQRARMGALLPALQHRARVLHHRHPRLPRRRAAHLPVIQNRPPPRSPTRSTSAGTSAGSSSPALIPPPPSRRPQRT
ncbi:hypothetical protein BC834DRAFT_886785 [Gloeopeniophorella convolvens]|nr:hypothetical protein BC834DRAFT_886785 [Gloeopeniophorella convolvens]